MPIFVVCIALSFVLIAISIAGALYVALMLFCFAIIYWPVTLGALGLWLVVWLLRERETVQPVAVLQPVSDREQWFWLRGYAGATEAVRTAEGLRRRSDTASCNRAGSACIVWQALILS